MNIQPNLHPKSIRSIYFLPKSTFPFLIPHIYPKISYNILLMGSVSLSLSSVRRLMSFMKLSSGVLEDGPGTLSTQRNLATFIVDSVTECFSGYLLRFSKVYTSEDLHYDWICLGLTSSPILYLEGGKDICSARDGYFRSGGLLMESVDPMVFYRLYVEIHFCPSLIDDGYKVFMYCLESKIEFLEERHVLAITPPFLLDLEGMDGRYEEAGIFALGHGVNMNLVEAAALEPFVGIMSKGMDACLVFKDGFVKGHQMFEEMSHRSLQFVFNKLNGNAMISVDHHLFDGVSQRIALTCNVAKGFRDVLKSIEISILTLTKYSFADSLWLKMDLLEAQTLVFVGFKGNGMVAYLVFIGMHQYYSCDQPAVMDALMKGKVLVMLPYKNGGLSEDWCCYMGHENADSKGHFVSFMDVGEVTNGFDYKLQNRCGGLRCECWCISTIGCAGHNLNEVRTHITHGRADLEKAVGNDLEVQVMNLKLSNDLRG